MSTKLTIHVLLVGIVAFYCGYKKKVVAKTSPTEMAVTSAAFKNNESIPAKYTCKGENVSPPLSWAGFPEATQSFALICEDPDAPTKTFVHWVIFNIPVQTPFLVEKIPPHQKLQNGAIQGKNDFVRIGYGGPCPPQGKPHRYVFKIYALNSMLNLAEGERKAALEKAMEGRILAQGQLVGMFEIK